MDGYTLLEYIESDGTQYIDTGFNTVSFLMKLDIQFFKRTNRSLMGFSDKAACYFGINTEGYYELGGGYVSTFSGLQRREIVIESTSSGMSLTAGDSVISRSRTSAVNTSFLLFGAPSTSGLASYPCSARLYSCKIYVGESLVRDYIPCMDNNGVYGLYDKVNGVFYASATDSGFTGKWAENKTLNVSMSEYRHRMLNLIPKTGLPKGYFRCEYIESDGTNYIDTGFKPNQDTKVVLDFYSSGASSYKCIFGARIKNGEDCFAFWIKDDIAHPQIADNSYNKYSFNVSTKQRIIYIIDKNVATFGTSSVTMDSSAFQSQYNLYLFNCNQAGTAASDYFIRGKLYSCQIYDNGVKVRDYVPCVSPDGYFGLYDLVTDEFYGFQGIGRGRVILPSGYTNAEYIASDGNQWIDTGHRPMSENLRVVLDFEYTASYSSKSLYGSQKASSLVFSILPHSGFFLVGSSGSSLLSTSYAVGTRYLLDAHADNGNFSVSLDGSLRTTTYTKPLYKDNTLYLFASHNGTKAAEMSSLKMYFLQIHDNGTFTKFFIPCKKDGIFGLYEMFEGIFYSSEGSSEFTGESDGDNEESGGDNEGSGGDDVVTISFTINGVSYQAEEGMIWYDWCNSSYNDGRFECSGLQFEVFVKGSETRLYDGCLQYGQDIIREGRVYEYFIL